MYYRQISGTLRTALAHPRYSSKVFTLIEENRSHLRQWLPWLDGAKTESDSRQFLQTQLESYAKGESLTSLIEYEGELVGIAGFNTIASASRCAQIGYWLAAKHCGKGIMSRVVADLLKLGQEDLELSRFEIRCATGNKASRAIPERLGFQHEGTLRKMEKLYGTWVDHELYAKIV